MHQALLTIDIKEISTIRFYYNLYKKENEIFKTSLYEIDCLIEEALQDEDEEIREEIEKWLLPKYKEYIDIFSKVASNQLALH